MGGIRSIVGIDRILEQSWRRIDSVEWTILPQEDLPKGESPLYKVSAI